MLNFEDKLFETRNLLLHEISCLSQHELNQTIEINTWTIAQICHHLIIVEMLFADAIVYGLKRKNDKEIEPKRIEVISDRSQKIDAPEISKPSSEQFHLEEIIQMFRNSRKKFLDVLSSIEDKSLLVKKSAKHPVLGELPLYQWIELLYLHELRHIEQIKRLKK